jgi:hypothetical protein
MISAGTSSYQWKGVFNPMVSRCTVESIVVGSDTVMQLSDGILRYRRGHDRITASAKDYNYTGSILSFLINDPETMPEVAAIKTFAEGLKSLELLNPQIIRSRSREAEDVGSGGERLAGYLSHLPKDQFDSPTEREERNQHDGSSLERVPGKQGEIPRPLGRKRRQRLLSPGLALEY